jgi:hypothetical protein
MSLPLEKVMVLTRAIAAIELMPAAKGEMARLPKGLQTGMRR